MKYFGSKTLETERLVLRKIKIEDALLAFYNWCNSEIVDKYVLWKKHPASGRVMEKTGMKFEGRLRSCVIDKNNIRNDLLSYSITKEEYFSTCNDYR